MNWRQIEVDGKTYRWRGRSFFIIKDEEGKRVAGANGHEIKNAAAPDVNSPDTWERGQWKRTVDGMVRPHEITAYIRKVTA